MNLTARQLGLTDDNPQPARQAARQPSQRRKVSPSTIRRRTIRKLSTLKVIKGRSTLVLFALESYCDEAGYCWPSQVTLASVTGLDKRTVIRAVGDLIAAGLVVKIKRPRGGWTDKRANAYRLTLPDTETIEEKLAEKDAAAQRIGDNLTLK